MGEIIKEESAFITALTGPLLNRRALLALVSEKSRFKEAKFALKVWIYGNADIWAYNQRVSLALKAIW